MLLFLAKRNKLALLERFRVDGVTLEEVQALAVSCSVNLFVLY